MIAIVCGVLLAGLLSAAAISDARRFVIPNWICLAVAGLFVLVAGLGWGELPLLAHVFTGACVFAVGTGIFAFGLMGGGDVKLWGALGLWLGPDLIWTHVVMVALLGGLLGIALLAGRVVVRRNGEGAALASSPVPYGVPISVAAILLLPQVSPLVVLN